MTDEAKARRARALAFDLWMRDAAVAAPARPEQELLAEHHVMGMAIAAMDEEARRLAHGEPLRPDFWQTVVDVIGNFVHRVHRRKEEEAFFPALHAWGLVDAEHSKGLERAHRALGQLTQELCDGVGEGDWEKVFRVVVIYLDHIRSHLAAEEIQLLSPALAELPVERIEPVRLQFLAIEREALGERGRRSVLADTRRLCQEVGLAELHHEVDTW